MNRKIPFQKIFWIGLMLFSMFFGAGNLIFAPFLGVQAAGNTPLALFGFLCTSVVVPILAIVILAKFKDGRSMLETISKPLAIVFMSLVYLLIGPCIAIPRTATTSFEMFEWLIAPTALNRVLFALVFFAASFFVALHPNKLKDVLGKVMSPILLVLVGVVCVGSLVQPDAVSQIVVHYDQNPFSTGFVEGYQTMDILAAFCFGSIMVMNIKNEGVEHKKAIHAVLVRAAIIAGVLLAGVYSLLAFSGMLRSETLLAATNGAQVLSMLAEQLFGGFGQVINALIFLIACFNVCTGLLSCVSEYFHELVPRWSYRTWLIVFTVAGIVVSCFGLDAILSLSAPVAILFLVYGIFKKSDSHA
ncbi:branched-chain amino acid transport system II carrier protein [uncultured Dubosiella sp.]|uniref:branched-chain amino acid transport system II carrier protein n=1 Tax=uncultured Dubosiella sp. TaxID=1937011 RepID=UPI00272FDDE2|nr:branched-chain amino acid transport system II carrier protein [uncultured Dubosiella sp.]